MERSMELELQDIKLKLLITSLLIPSAKSLMSILLLVLPFSHPFQHCSFLTFFGSKWAISPSLHRHLDSLLSYLLSPSIASHPYLPFLIIYLHFTIVLGSSFCNLYQASKLLSRPDPILISSPQISPKVHISLVMSTLSLIFHMFPLLFLSNPAFVSLLAAAQIGMELAIFHQFHLLIKTIRQIDMELNHLRTQAYFIPTN